MTLPLEGVRVIEVGQALAGPLAGVLLADMGADVIKIEKPDGGDDARIWGPPFGPDGVTSLYFYSQNRNKRSVALDLKSAGRHREAAQALRDGRHPDPEPAARRGRRDRHRARGDAEAPSAADLLLDLGVRLPGADADEAGLRSAAAGLWRHDVGHRPGRGSADLLRRLDQRQGDRHVLHHRRAGGAAHARQDGQGLPGRHLAVRFGGPLGRGAGQQLHRERRRPAAPRHRRRGDRALPDLRHAPTASRCAWRRATTGCGRAAPRRWAIPSGRPIRSTPRARRA